MDHTTVLAGLTPERKAFLTQRSNSDGLRHLCGYLAAMAICTAYIAFQAPFWGFALLPQGILISFLFTLSHECTHYTPFRSKRLNDLTGHAIGALLAMPFTWFRYFHLAHHKYTNDPDNDPELEGGGRPETWGQYIVHLSGFGFWKGGLTTIWRNAFYPITASYLPPRQHPAMQREARILIAVYMLALLSLLAMPLLLWTWIVPALIGQPFLRLYLLAEHGHCPPVADMLENSRTTYTTRVVRFLAWNMPYHAEHHSFPNVPFHKLPDLHDDLQAHLKSTSKGYARFTKDFAAALDR
jgi:fatty acid desaturase